MSCGKGTGVGVLRIVSAKWGENVPILASSSSQVTLLENTDSGLRDLGRVLLLLPPAPP